MKAHRQSARCAKVRLRSVCRRHQVQQREKVRGMLGSQEAAYRKVFAMWSGSLSHIISVEKIWWSNALRMSEVNILFFAEAETLHLKREKTRTWTVFSLSGGMLTSSSLQCFYFLPPRSDTAYQRNIQYVLHYIHVTKLKFTFWSDRSHLSFQWFFKAQIVKIIFNANLLF